MRARPDVPGPFLRSCVAALSLALALGCAAARDAGRAAPSRDAMGERCGVMEPLVGTSFGRTELVFGRARIDGRTVTLPEWQDFVDSQVAPRFPDGFTVLMGKGQYQGTGGIAVREDSFVLVLLYSLRMDDSSRKIEEIRSAYKTAFRQESVLRVDGTACVSF